MKRILKYKWFILAAVSILIVLIVAFLLGGKGRDLPEIATPSEAVKTTVAAENDITEPRTAAETTLDETTALPTTAVTISPNTQAVTQVVTERYEETQPVTDKYRTEPTPTDKPAPVEPQEQTTVDNTLRCTLVISCTNALASGDLEDEVRAVLPSDGYIVKPERITFTEGESAYDLVLRVCREKSIHFDATFTPLYNSCYVKGIGNLYEFDCGESSGWMFKVNDWFPNYGMSRYALRDGDTLSLLYTCDGGFDVGERQ